MYRILGRVEDLGSSGGTLLEIIVIVVGESAEGTASRPPQVAPHLLVNVFAFPEFAHRCGPGGLLVGRQSRSVRRGRGGGGGGEVRVIGFNRLQTIERSIALSAATSALLTSSAGSATSAVTTSEVAASISSSLCASDVVTSGNDTPDPKRGTE